MTIEDFLLARAEEQGGLVSVMIHSAIDFHKKWPVLVETKPEFDMMPDSFEAVQFKMTQRMLWLTEEEYRKKFGSAPPTAPLLRQWATMFSDHEDFNEEWMTQ